MTGVFAMDEDEKTRSTGYDEDDVKELDDDVKKEPDNDEALIVRAM